MRRAPNEDRIEAALARNQAQYKVDWRARYHSRRRQIALAGAMSRDANDDWSPAGDPETQARASAAGGSGVFQIKELWSPETWERLKALGYVVE